MESIKCKKKGKTLPVLVKKSHTGCQEELPTHKSDKCQLQFIAAARISLPRFRYVGFYFGLCVQFFLMEGKMCCSTVAAAFYLPPD